MLDSKESNGHQTNTHFGWPSLVVVTWYNSKAVEKLDQQENANALPLSEV